MIAYVGNCSFEESEEYRVSADKWGLDILTRSFEGRRDLLREFMRTLIEGSPDPEYPEFALERREANIGRAFASVVVTYAGLFDGRLPNVRKQGGWRLQTVQAKRGNSNESTTIEYRAPTTTYRYVTESQPKEQKYAGKLLPTKKAFEIIDRRGGRGPVAMFSYGGTTDLLRPGSSIGPAAGPGSSSFELERDVVCSAFDFEQAGKHWRVTEENEGRLIERSLAEDLPRFIYNSGE